MNLMPNFAASSLPLSSAVTMLMRSGLYPAATRSACVLAETVTIGLSR